MSHLHVANHAPVAPRQRHLERLLWQQKTAEYVERVRAERRRLHEVETTGPNAPGSSYERHIGGQAAAERCTVSATEDTVAAWQRYPLYGGDVPHGLWTTAARGQAKVTPVVGQPFRRCTRFTRFEHGECWDEQWR